MPSLTSTPIVLFLQARMSSSRLPGKMLRPIAGRTLFDRVVERCRKSRETSHLVVLTSADASDDVLAAACVAQKVECHRGELQDVAARFASAIRSTGPQAFVRICGDSPFIDPAVIDEAVRAYRVQAVNLVTNVFPRSFPKGQSVEVVRSEAFLKVLPRMTAAGEREHVTQVFYRLSSDFKIHNFHNIDDLSQENLCVDTAADLERAEAACRALGARAATCSWREALAAMKEAQPS